MLARHGECNRCGWCCRYAAWSVSRVENPQGLSDPDYYRTRGFTLHFHKGMATMATAQVLHEQRCPEMAGDDCGMIESPARPRTCGEFPSRPEQVIGIPCSYWFETDNGNIGGDASPYPSKR
jgi:Fe-S-cluster containining protein